MNREGRARASIPNNPSSHPEKLWRAPPWRAISKRIHKQIACSAGAKFCVCCCSPIWDQAFTCSRAFDRGGRLLTDFLPSGVQQRMLTHLGNSHATQGTAALGQLHTATPWATRCSFPFKHTCRGCDRDGSTFFLKLQCSHVHTVSWPGWW